MKERRALRSALLEVGADAPTACGDWSATDLAVHVAVGELNGGWAAASMRTLVARGIRVDRMAGFNAKAVASYRRRHGFDWAVERLDRPPPRSHRAGPVVEVSLLEAWAHHDDVLIANGRRPCTSGIDLEPVVRVLARYHRRALRKSCVVVATGEVAWLEPESARATVEGPVPQLARWLAGRCPIDALSVTGESDAIDAVTAMRMGI